MGPDFASPSCLPLPHHCTQLMADSRLQMEELRGCLGSILWWLTCLVATEQVALCGSGGVFSRARVV